MNLLFAKTVQLDKKLKARKLTIEDIERVRQIPVEYLRVPNYKVQSNADEAIDYVAGLAQRDKLSRLAVIWFSDAGTEATKILGMRRLVASLAYALGEQESDVARCRERRGTIVANDLFYDSKSAARFAKRLANKEGEDVCLFKNGHIGEFTLKNRHIIRTCPIFWSDCPSYRAYVQTLNPRRKIVSSIEYLDARYE